MRERGKEHLIRREYALAHQCLSYVQSSIPSWKLRATLLGLRVAPQLVRAVVHSRWP